MVDTTSGKTWIAATLIVIATALAMLLYVFIPHLLSTGHPIGEYKPEFPEGSWSVVKISLGAPAGSNNWQCVFVFNESNLLYKCWGYRYWIEITLSNGTLLEWRKLWDTPIEFRSSNETVLYSSNETGTFGITVANLRKPPPTLFYSITAIADLLNKRAYAVEEARTDEIWPGLERYVKVVENTMFDYKWVKLSEDLYADWTWALTYISNNTFKAYLAFMDYILDEETGVVRYHPTPIEVAEKYLKYVTETYSKLLREVGVTVVFELINPNIVCSYPKMATTLEVLYSNITCREYNGVNVLGVVRAPHLPNRTMGMYMPSKRLILIKEGPDSFSPHVFIHEVGHALSLVDLSESLDLPEAALALYTSSIMSSSSGGTGISVGDLVVLLLNAYRHVKSHGSESDAEILRAKLVDLGIDPENASILLPLTPLGELPLCFRSLLGALVLRIDPRNPENCAMNHHVIQAMIMIARFAKFRN